MSSNSLIPADEPPAANHAGSRPESDEPSRGPQRKRRRRPQKPPILTADDIRRMMAQLLKLLALGSITTSNANSMKGILSELLKDACRAERDGSAPAMNDDLMQRLKDSPELLEFAMPLLSADQLAKIVGVDDEDPET
jgi:hypothetical protein